MLCAASAKRTPFSHNCKKQFRGTGQFAPYRTLQVKIIIEFLIFLHCFLKIRRISARFHGALLRVLSHD
jgi:hypothetical protein